MAGSKREHELHRAKLARQRKEAAETARRRKKLLRNGGAVVAALIVVLALVGVAVATSSSDDPSATGAPEPTASVGSDDPNAPVSCSEPNGEKPNNKQSSGVKDTKLMKNATYKVDLTTNCGPMTFSMDIKNAPETARTVAYLSNLVEFYNNTTCHRLTTAGIYVLQCGDPNGDGTGGPGFAIDEENLPKAGSDGTAVYERGTVAMANAGKGTTGSQFFLVYQDSALPPAYTVLGEVTAGMNVLDHVAAQGTEDGSSDGTPKQPLQIQKMQSFATYEVEQ